MRSITEHMVIRRCKRCRLEKKWAEYDVDNLEYQVMKRENQAAKAAPAEVQCRPISITKLIYAITQVKLLVPNNQSNPLTTEAS